MQWNSFQLKSASKYRLIFTGWLILDESIFLVDVSKCRMNSHFLPTPKQIGPRPNQTEICFTFVSNPPVSWGSCRVLSQLDKCTAASAALNGQSEIETEPTRGVHLTFNPSHKTLLVLLYSISPWRPKFARDQTFWRTYFFNETRPLPDLSHKDIRPFDVYSSV